MDIGRVAYEGYFASCEGKSIRGEDLPPWPAQAPEIREHWRASADAVTMFLDLLGNNPDSTGEEFKPGPTLTPPDWLADAPTNRERLRLIMAAVHRCCMEHPEGGMVPTGPHMTASMAEEFIAQMLPVEG